MAQVHSPRTDNRLARGQTACQRCRRRKQKCDLNYPSCSNCERAGVPCVTYDSGKQTESLKVPRNYVSHLEEQIQKLQRELHELRSQSQPISVDVGFASAESASIPGHERSATPAEVAVTSDRDPSHFQDLANDVTSVPMESSTQQQFLGPSSGGTLARLVMATLRVDKGFLEQRKQQSYNISSTAPHETLAALPPRHAADFLVDIYFQYRTPHLPIVDRYQAKKALDGAYSCPDARQPATQTATTDLFTTYMILAIGLYDLPNPTDPGSRGRLSESDDRFVSALVWIESVITISNIATLRAVLLVTQFVALNPLRGSLWHLTGIALRLCIDMGLHWDVEETTYNMDPDSLHERRRLWYSTYHLDRVLCIILGRPFGIADDSARVPLPNPWMKSARSGCEANEFDTYNQRAHNHMFGLSMLESEIKHVQHNQTLTPKLASPKINYSAWLLDIQPRLQEWYDTVPQPSKAHPSAIFAQQAYWDSLYNNAILLIFRPNPTVIPQPPEALCITFDASCKLIASIDILQREGKSEMSWKTVHHLFMAGLGVIYCIWQSKDSRDLNPVTSKLSALQSCASMLSAMAETFPSASGCRDVFDILLSPTIDFLVTKDTEGAQHTRAGFENQVQDLLQRFRSPNDQFTWSESNAGNFSLSTMLSTDGFAFGEMLSSAAQWPEFQDMDFNNMGMDMMNGVTMDSNSYAGAQYSLQ